MHAVNPHDKAIIYDVLNITKNKMLCLSEFSKYLCNKNVYEVFINFILHVVYTQTKQFLTYKRIKIAGMYRSTGNEIRMLKELCNI